MMIIDYPKTFESCPICNRQLKYAKSFGTLSLFCDNNLKEDFCVDTDYLKSEYFICYSKYSNNISYCQFILKNYQIINHESRITHVYEVNNGQRNPFAKHSKKFKSIQDQMNWLNSKNLLEILNNELNLYQNT